jgi:uncharacterized protein YprB with RNaseH-like and TPR domain
MLVFDLETDGLLNDVTCIHCIVIYDSETHQTLAYNDQGSHEPVVRGIQLLQEAEVVAGHNVLYFDIPVIKKIYPWFECTALVVDTLLLSRLYHANMMDIDKRRNIPHMPQHLYAKHSLESWGYRLGEYKGEFGKTADWKNWSREMQDYCEQDVNVTTKLCDHFWPYLNGLR